MSGTIERRLPGGVEVHRDGVHARVWAPECDRIEFVLDASGARHPLARETDGHHSGFIAGIGAGTRYALLLDGQRLRPDPCSRFQPEGPHGPSQVIDPSTYHWTDASWRGPAPGGHVLYEMQIGRAHV